LNTREWVLAAVSLAAIVATLFVPAIPQDPAYHAFVDMRELVGVPNFWNVFSNVGYLVVGVYGLMNVRRLSSPEMRPAYITFCVGVFFVGFGSSWYHYTPSTESLVWDRLPMAVGFMALFSLVLADRVSGLLAQRLLWPLVAAGVASVFYWAWTEQRGAGDLRPYALVQFLPIVLMPLLLLMFPGSGRSTVWLWYTFAGYAVAKVAEQLDGPIYAALGLSGHSIKHFVSSVAVLFAVFALLEMKLRSAYPEREMRVVR
jgi:hypothetical protein